MKKKIETSEERLKQDEYGLYINAPSYIDQRARMEHETKKHKELFMQANWFMRWITKRWR